MRPPCAPGYAAYAATLIVVVKNTFRKSQDGSATLLFQKDRFIHLGFLTIITGLSKIDDEQVYSVSIYDSISADRLEQQVLLHPTLSH